MRVEIRRNLPGEYEQAWNRLGKASVYLESRWMRYQEMSRDVDPWYVLVWSGDELCACTSAYRVGVEENSLYLPPPGVGVGPGDYLLVGNRRGYRNSLLISGGDYGHALESLIEGLSLLADRLEVRWLWWPFLDDKSAEALMTVRGAIGPALLCGDCVIPLPGVVFEDYLRSVSTSVRKRVRRDRALFRRAGYATGAGLLSELLDPVARLASNLDVKHGGSDSADELKILLAQQSECMGDRARVDYCSVDDNMIGMNVRFRGATEIASRVCGFDYRQTLDACEYFELAYYRAIEACYRAGLGQLSLGVGTYETKIRRGATVSLEWGVAVSLNGERAQLAEFRRRNAERWNRLLGDGLRAEAVKGGSPVRWME